MRILVYGLQSSGASVFTLWLSQQEDYLGVIDLYVGRKPPTKKEVPNENVILKATVSNLDLDECVKLFQPDKTILFVRDPYQNYLSLKKKLFKNIGGNIKDKFKKLNNVFEQGDRFDVVITYEDFVQYKSKVIEQLNSLGIQVTPESYLFRRSPEDIIRYNCTHSDYLKRTHKQVWDIGNIHRTENGVDLNLKRSIVGFVAKRKVDTLAPNVVGYYHAK